MHTSLFKTSLYTRSLLANPPPVALPQIPTLAELRERTDAMPLPVPIATRDQGTQTSSPSSFSSWSPPKSLLPPYSHSNGSSPPEYQPPTLLKNSFKRLNSTSTAVGQRGIVMKGSRGYVRDVKDRFGRQPEIEQVESEHGEKGWISWLTCRG